MAVEPAKSRESVEFQEEIKAEVKKKRKRNKDLSSSLNKQKKQEVKPKSVYVDVITQAQEEIKEGLAFLHEIENEPRTIFTDTKKVLRSNRDMICTIFSHSRKARESVKSHDFQMYLAHVANKHLQNWLQEKGIEESFYVAVRTPNQYPSIFAIYHEDNELIQFNLFDQWYGVRQRRLSIEKVIEKHNKRIEFLDKEIQKQEEYVESIKKRRENPLKHYKGFRNFLIWLFKGKELSDAFDKHVDRSENALLRLRKERETDIQSFQFTLDYRNEGERLLHVIEPFFKELAYELNTESHRLY